MISVRTRVLSAFSAVAMAVAVIGTPVVSAQAGSQITWEDCPAQVDISTAQCGRIDVPMHYSDPGLGDISVGFVKVPAADPAAMRRCAAFRRS